MDNVSIGKQVRRFRERAHVQSQELAEAVGISPSAMSLVESGERALKASELARITDYLGISPIGILDSDSILARLSVAARSTDGEVPVMQRMLYDLATLHELLKTAEIPNVEVPTPPKTSTARWLQDSKRLAAWARERFDDDGPWRFETLADRITGSLGIDVVVNEFNRTEECGASITDAEFPFILVNGNQRRSRALFTLAHELGHVLARDADGLFVDRSLSGSDAETFANAFAAELLMPEDVMRQEVVHLSFSATRFAELLIQFQVSFETFLYRLHNLHFINAAERDELRDVGFSGLMASLDDIDLKSDLMVTVETLGFRRSPEHFIRRLIMGFEAGVVSVRPIAGLLGEPEDGVLARLVQSTDSREHDFILRRGAQSQDTPAEAFAGQPF